MKLLMLSTQKGSPYGNTVEEYSIDVEYEIPEKLAKVFLSLEWAKEVAIKETKALKATFVSSPPMPTENKALVSPSSEDKAEESVSASSKPKSRRSIRK